MMCPALSALHLLTKTVLLLITPESGTIVMSIEQMRKQAQRGLCVQS